MNERIQTLREQSLEAKPYLSAERAILLTDFYASGQADRVSTPVARGLALKHLFEHKAIAIGEEDPTTTKPGYEEDVATTLALGEEDDGTTL